MRVSQILPSWSLTPFASSLHSSHLFFSPSLPHAFSFLPPLISDFLLLWHPDTLCTSSLQLVSPHFTPLCTTSLLTISPLSLLPLSNFPNLYSFLSPNFSFCYPLPDTLPTPFIPSSFYLPSSHFSPNPFSAYLVPMSFLTISLTSSSLPFLSLPHLSSPHHFSPISSTLLFPTPLSAILCRPQSHCCGRLPHPYQVIYPVRHIPSIVLLYKQ